jgi:hypothetical protein
VTLPLPFGSMLGPVFEAARIGLFGFAAVRQQHFYCPPDLFGGGALIGALQGTGDYGRLSRRRHDARFVPIPFAAVAIGDDPSSGQYTTNQLRFWKPGWRNVTRAAFVAGAPLGCCVPNTHPASALPLALIAIIVRANRPPATKQGVPVPSGE